METYFTALIAIVSLLVAMWVPLTTGSSGVGPKRVLAWCAIVLATLILPSMLLTWCVMQVAARVLAPMTNDVSTFVIQIAWSVGAVSTLYPLLWGVKFCPFFERWISNSVVS